MAARYRVEVRIVDAGYEVWVFCEGGIDYRAWHGKYRSDADAMARLIRQGVVQRGGVLA